MQWRELADRVFGGHQVTADEALGVLHSPDDELLPLLHAAFRLRERHHGRDVRIHVLRNAKSGLCPENCAFCSQSVAFHTEAPRYQLQSVEELVDGARVVLMPPLTTTEAEIDRLVGALRAAIPEACA